MFNVAGSNQQSSSNSDRLVYVDSAKGLCVILVVIMHTLTVEDLFQNLLYVLRMPLFYFCSGLFCAGAMGLNWSRFLATKVSPIFWNYVVWSTIVYFATFAVWGALKRRKSRFNQAIDNILVAGTNIVVSICARYYLYFDKNCSQTTHCYRYYACYRILLIQYVPS